ncbi:MAG: hypothetical protein WCT18_02930 [Patescibacteria group bacterium]
MEENFQQEAFEQMEDWILNKFIAEQGHIFELRVAGDLKTVLKMGHFRAIIYYSQFGEFDRQEGKLYCQIKSVGFRQETNLLNQRKSGYLDFYFDGMGNVFSSQQGGSWEGINRGCAGVLTTMVHKIVIY